MEFKTSRLTRDGGGLIKLIGFKTSRAQMLKTHKWAKANRTSEGNMPIKEALGPGPCSKNWRWARVRSCCSLMLFQHLPLCPQMFFSILQTGVKNQIFFRFLVHHTAISNLWLRRGMPLSANGVTSRDILFIWACQERNACRSIFI